MGWAWLWAWESQSAGVSALGWAWLWAWESPLPRELEMGVAEGVATAVAFVVARKRYESAQEYKKGSLWLKR